MTSPKKILVVKLDALGDIISITPFLEVLGRSFPDAEITYVVGSWSKAVLQNNPDIDDLIVVDSQKWQKGLLGKLSERKRILKELIPQKFDTVFILHGPAPFAFWEKITSQLGAQNRIGYRKHAAKTTFTKSQKLPEYQDHLFKVLDKNRAEHYLDLLRVAGVEDTANRGNQLYPSAQDLAFADDYFTKHELAGHPIIAFSPGGAVNPGMKQLAKRWPLERFADAIKQLSEWNSDLRFVAIGGPGDREVIDQVIAKLPPSMKQKVFSSAGETNVHQSATLIAKSNLFIGNDSGPLHIASTTKTPLIAIFGPTNPEVDAPYKLKGKILFHKTKTSPCYTMDCAGHDRCIDHVTVDEVVSAAKGLLANQ